MTILQRGNTGGFAMTADEDDKGMYTRDELFARMVFAMGGRSAEELVFGEPTTGASNDIEQATKIARAMVTEYGMSSVLGAVKYGEQQGDPFSGRGAGGTLEYSPAVAETIDREMHELLDAAHQTAYAILSRYRDELDLLVTKLLEKETLRRPDLEEIFDTITPERPELPLHDARFTRQADREPVKTPVELAIERGEEPPKRFSILEASKATRERRRQEREAGNNAQQPHRPKHSKKPTYGGPTPPPNWQYPGQGQQPQSQQPRWPEQTGQAEEIGFRLPEHEQPDNPLPQNARDMPEQRPVRDAEELENEGEK